MFSSLLNRIERIDLRWRLTIAIAVELIYMFVSRVIAYETDTFAHVEILRTPFRIGAAIFFWLTMGDVLRLPIRRPETLAHPVHIAVLFLVTTSVFLGPDPQYSPEDAIITALTSIPVGFAEELFFRGIVQNLCVKRWGGLAGLTIASAVFTAYHVGVTGDDALNYMSIFLAGFVLGAIYLKSGSLLAVIAIHAVYDALFSLPFPFGSVDTTWRVAVEFAAALAALHWTFRKNNLVASLDRA